MPWRTKGFAEIVLETKGPPGDTGLGLLSLGTIFFRDSPFLHVSTSAPSPGPWLAFEGCFLTIFVP